MEKKSKFAAKNLHYEGEVTTHSQAETSTYPSVSEEEESFWISCHELNSDIDFCAKLVVSPIKNSVVSEHPRRNSSYSVSEEEVRVHRKETMVASIGVLEIFIHQARDIHNICIYQKQDVYAKLCLTSDPETTVSTQIINGGGQNPVFNESLRLTVKTTDSSLKCEIWMLSRVKNYLEDQLLGFALVPLSDIFSENGRLEQDFSLSSNDLFHSPAGFVQLAISYSGESPEVVEIPTPRASLSSNTTLQDSKIPDTLQSHYDKIEFPDPDIANENNLMVSEYYGMSCSTLDSQSSESLSTSDANNNLTSGVDADVVQSFSSAISNPIEVAKNDAPASSVSTNGSPSVSNPVSSQSPPDTPGVSKSSNQDVVSRLQENTTDALKDESDSSDGLSSNKFTQTITAANIVPQQIMVQQDIVDMYMKSMQQFTESLAKMKLPMDIENGTNSSGNTNSGSDKKLEASKSTGSRVFYGSRAFF